MLGARYRDTKTRARSIIAATSSGVGSSATTNATLACAHTRRNRPFTVPGNLRRQQRDPDQQQDYPLAPADHRFEAVDDRIPRKRLYPGEVVAAASDGDPYKGQEGRSPRSRHRAQQHVRYLRNEGRPHQTPASCATKMKAATRLTANASPVVTPKTTVHRSPSDSKGAGARTLR